MLVRTIDEIMEVRNIKIEHNIFNVSGNESDSEDIFDLVAMRTNGDSITLTTKPMRLEALNQALDLMLNEYASTVTNILDTRKYLYKKSLGKTFLIIDKTDGTITSEHCYFDHAISKFRDKLEKEYGEEAVYELVLDYSSLDAQVSGEFDEIVVLTKSLNTSNTSDIIMYLTEIDYIDLTDLLHISTDKLNNSHTVVVP